ncbi:hypothetical protein CK203_040262 [Vitis vinifera]|uniref:Endonuclease/exonuclease/phosphatase domain-containing protein n=1 Tax=Vitis vinifera TaxID=29760 RepID=A0A438HXF9_VITVI|nr:hypothetical protein CK203_040262 [Vitis vinifera]
MVETLQRLGFANGGETSQKEEELRLKPSMVKTFAEVVKMPRAKKEHAARGDDLRSWGTHLAKIWSLKGNLGLTKLERGKVLLEFELLIEAEKALKLGSILSEAWVQIVGLPVSLWDRDILRRIGEECGGFLTVDSQTEKLEELQWARILVKRNGEELPNVVEVWVEELCYSITLWWEIRPVMRAATARKRGKKVVTGGELSGSGSLWILFEALTGRRVGPKKVDLLCGPSKIPWSSKKSGSIGLAPFSDISFENGSSLLGLSSRKNSGWAKTLESLVVPGLDSQGPSMPLVEDRAQLGEARPSMVTGQSLVRGPDVGISPFWVKDGLRRPSEEEIQFKGRAKTDCALLEEAVRGFTGRLCNVTGSTEQETVTHWELMEVNIDSIEESREELCLVRTMPQEVRGWEEVSWEESDLARELKRLECSINYEGGRSRRCFARKRVPDYGSPMKLRLLSWNVRGANDSSKRKVIKAMIRSQKVDLFCIQEKKIQSMLEGMVRSLGSGRFLDWGAMGAHGAAGGILICWDKRTLEVLEMEWGSSQFLGIWDDPWCLGGDFNVTLSQRERSNQGRLTGAMRRFAQVVDELELLDLPLQGGVFSWSGVTQTHFRSLSHLAEGWWVKTGPIPFRFENMWLKVDGFKDLLGLVAGVGGRGRASFRLATNLKVMKEKIKGWNRDVFGRLEVNKNSPSNKSNSGMGWRVKGVSTALRRAGWRADIEGMHLQSLNLNEAEVLELPFTEEEIHFALMEMNGDKAPARWVHSGLLAILLGLVKEEIVDLFKEFFDKKSFAKSLNTTFLVLIPKKGLAQDGLWVSLDGVDLVVHFNCKIFVLVNGVQQVISPIPGGCVKEIPFLLTFLSWVEDIDEMAVELGCRVGSLPSVYLGLPLGAHHKASSMWDGVEERMRRRSRNVWSGGWKEILKEANWCWDNIGFKLFALAVHKNATVNEVWDSSLGQGGWNIRFSRDSNDWELDAIGELFHMLRDLRISSEEDSMIWKGGGHGSFRIRDAYKLLAAPSAITFPKKSIWVDKWSGSSGRSSCLGLGSMSVPRDGQGALLWGKEEKDLELHPVVYFLDVGLGVYGRGVLFAFKLFGMACGS